ncbi:OmpA family protein [Sphingomonas laterariae]|uniref:OmpA family protein n=1 Tax=Edaphosphingomonas laterariae TaxID=861865 RepID=A0A239HTH8_9SPHN|nr:flagellar motor protein MotB [Sphingomonas laterariae]SNS84541.1 OmpA family protein [Sphingomonas laterariae]
MTAARSPRWAVSFADLCLLLLGFFILLQVRNDRPDLLSAGLRSAFGTAPAEGVAGATHQAAALFQPGEAVLTPAASAMLRGLGARARADRKALRIISQGSDGGARRFDRWELAAARAAAIGRAASAGGLAEGDIEIALPTTQERAGKGQNITLLLVPAG